MWNRRLGKEIMSFSGWTALAALASIIQSQSLTLVINVFLGPIVNAALGIANQVNAAVKSFSLNVGVSLSPQIVKSYAQNDYSRLNILILSGAKVLLLLFIALAMPLMLEITFFLDIWLVEVPLYAPQLVILLLICSIVDAMTSTYSGAIQATGNIRNYQIIFNSIYLCSLPIMILYMKYVSSNFYVPIVILILFSFLTNIVKIPYMIKLIPKYNWKENVIELFVKILIPVVVSLIFPLWIVFSMDESIVRVLIVSVSFEIVFAFVVYIFTLNSKEKSMLKNVISSFLKK